MTNPSGGARPTSRQRAAQLTARVAELETELAQARTTSMQWMMFHSRAAYGNQRARAALAAGATAEEALAILNDAGANSGADQFVASFVDAMVRDWTENPISTFTRGSVRDWLDRQRSRTIS